MAWRTVPTPARQPGLWRLAPPMNGRQPDRDHLLCCSTDGGHGRTVARSPRVPGARDGCPGHYHFHAPSSGSGGPDTRWPPQGAARGGATSHRPVPTGPPGEAVRPRDERSHVDALPTSGGTGQAPDDPISDHEIFAHLDQPFPPPAAEAALRTRGLKRAALALRAVAAKRSMARPRHGATAASSQGDLTPISAAAAALAIAAAQPVGMKLTDWLPQIMHCLRETQGSMDALQELFTRHLAVANAGDCAAGLAPRSDGPARSSQGRTDGAADLVHRGPLL